MSRYHLPMQWMSNFKAAQIDYEYYLTLGDEGRLYCLTDRDIYILMSQVEAYIGWLTRWYNTDDITQTEVGFIQSDLLEKLMSCVDIQVLIDQAKITANHETTNQLLQSQGVRDILEDRYDGTPTSINPSAPTTNFGSSGDRYDALCAAITAFVYKFAANQASVIRLNEIGGAAAIALIAALLIPGLNIFLLVGAGIAVLLGFGTIGVSSETAIAALTDQTALNDVICFMRDTLKAESVTQAHWDACLDTYPFTVGSHQAIDADFIKACLHDNYLSVLDMLGQGYDSVLAGDDLPDCPCAPPPPCYEFTLDDQGWIETSNATYTSSFGWRATTSGQFIIQNGNHTETSHSIKITFNNNWFDGSNDFHKFFVILSSYGGGNSQGFGTGADPLLTAPTGDITLTSTGSDWTGLNIQIAAGGYTWPTGVYITEVCINPA